MTDDVDPRPTVPAEGSPLHPEAGGVRAEAVPAPAPVAPVGPVAAAERIASVDVLRGFALLGILVMNIVAFGLPDESYMNPTVAGGFEGIDRVAWLASHLFFELKMMTLFSMLFGAGMVLMSTRAEARGGTARAVYYRRILWLLVIGLVHAYFIWWGDILVSYAECGLLLYLFRRRSPRALITVGTLAILVAVPMSIGLGHMIGGLRKQAGLADAALAAGKTPEELPKEQKRALEAWGDMRREFEPTPEELAREVVLYRDGYGGIFLRRAPKVFMVQTVMFVFLIVWRVGGVMLLGMGLMKLGAFSAERSPRFYGLCMLLGFGLGLPLIAYGARELIPHDFEVVFYWTRGSLYNYFGSLLMAIAYMGLVMRVCQSGALPGLRRRLAAVGQMALTNYLMHSLIATTLFYGYGLGLFATLSRAQLLGVVAAIWATQLALSPVWLKHFQFGPAEWAWRSLTYWKRQPMRIAPAGAAAPA